MAKIVKTTTSPSAWVVNSSDRGRKSIKKGKVYLNDKEEFQIELFNPLQDCVLADIKLNGKSISQTGLVINPGQRFYLDCFIDDKKKFVFNTYEVENNEESLNAIEKNGFLEVFFYKETVINVKNWINNFTKNRNIIIEKYYPYNPYINGMYYGNINNTAGYGTVTNTVANCVGNFGSTLTSGNITGTVNSYYSNTGASINSNFTSSVLSTTSNKTSLDNVETGRIEKGAKSKQKFESVDMDFDNYYIASTIIQLLPESRKPIEVKDLKKSFTDQDKTIDLLSKLGELYKSGILTDEEFTTKKAELLSKI